MRPFERGLCLGVSALIIGLSAGMARAGEFQKNAWGVYVAPTTHAFTQGYPWDRAASSTALDEGLYYTRFLGPCWSARLEVRFETRHLDTFVPDIFTSYVEYPVSRLSEDILEVPLVVERDERVLIDGHEIRLSVGAGALVAAVYDQRLVYPLGEEMPMYTGDYQKLGWLLDAGVTFAVHGSTGVFARFRYQRDETTFGEEGDRNVVRTYEAYGLAVGAEFPF